MKSLTLLYNLMNSFLPKICRMLPCKSIASIWIIALFLFISCPFTFSQSFPVQVIPQAVPPAPIYFSDYADETTINSPLRVQITLNDLTISSREILLKTSFEGNGISFQSNDIVTGAPMLFLEGGIPLSLTNVELAPYFKFENITGISPGVYGQAIPEGAYEFCFEVFDKLTGSRLSRRTCITTVVFQNEPPFLILPENGVNVEERNPQNIVFQWTPRHINVSNVEYELSIVEIRDPYVDYQAAFLSSPPIFQTVTNATTYVYNPADPLLLSNKSYAWRVQARALQGTEEIGLFKNQGFSQIYFFNYALPCNYPDTIRHEVKGTRNANIFWDDATTEVPEFIIRYRERGENDWFYARTNDNQVTLWDLRPGTPYEYQLSKKCQLAESEYSPVKTFTTFIADNEDSVYNCGIPPDIDVSSQVPLEELAVGDTFTAGDFPVKVLEVNGGNGRFNGKGYVTVPYLKSIKVAVEFSNIFINEEKQLAQGTVVTVYDPTLSGIIDPWDFVDDLGDLLGGGDHHVLDPVDFKIKDVKVSDDGKELIITGIDENGNPVEHRVPYDETDTYVISDGENVYTVGPDGIKKVGDAAEGGVATSDNTEGVSGGDGTVDSPSVTQWADDKVVVAYTQNTSAAYDWDEATGAREKDSYHSVNLVSGGKAYPIHKAVLDGADDSFYVDIDIKDATIIADSLIFKTINGLKLETVKEGANRFKVLVSGYSGYHSDEAIISYKKEDGTQVVVSSFFIHHLKILENAAVTLIAVNGNTAAKGVDKSKITSVFKPGAGLLSISTPVDFTIDQSAWDLDGNGKLNYDGSGLLSNHPSEFKAFYQHFKENYPSYSSEAYYVFVFDENIEPSSEIAGFMPRGSQFGFVFSSKVNEGASESKQTLEDVIAHEVGHGVFDLKHPYEAGKGPADNDGLMDSGSGIQLTYADWKKMGYEGIRFYGFDKDEDGEYTGNEMISKILQKIRCAIASGTPELQVKYFEKTGETFQSDYKEFGRIRVAIITDAIVRLSRVEITTKTVYSNSNYGLGQKDYILDYGGVKIYKRTTDIGTPNSQAITSLNQLQDHIFSYTEEDIKEDYERVLNTLIGKTKFNDEDIIALKDIANCAAKNFSVENKYIIIKKLAYYNDNLKERYEDLIFDLIENYESDSTTYANDFLDEFVNDPYGGELLKKLFDETENSGLLTLWRGNEQNFDRFLNVFYKLWSLSKYTELDNFEYDDVTDETILTPVSIAYDGDKWFPIATYSGRLEGGYTNIIKSISIPQYTPYGYQSREERTTLKYEHFQPVLIYLEGNNADIFEGVSPAFFLAGDIKRNNVRNNLKKAELAFDVVSTVSGIGNLAKLRHLRHLKHLSALTKTRKATIAGITFTSDVANIILKYTELCDIVLDDDFCESLESYNSYLQNALFATGVLQTAMNLSRLRAAKQYKKNRSKLVEEYGENHSTIKELDDHFLRDFLEHVELPQGLKNDIDVSDEIRSLFAQADELRRIELINAWEILESKSRLRKKARNLEILRSAMINLSVEKQSLITGISKSKSIQILIDNIGQAKSKYHVLVLLKDYDNIPGVVNGRYVTNSASRANVKEDFPENWEEGFELPLGAIGTFTGDIRPVLLIEGQKIYRVSALGSESGPYWTLTKPQNLEEVIGGTAVRPEWNNFEYITEYTVPRGVRIKAWMGKAARQEVSDVPSNYHLPGGSDQLFINSIATQDPNFNPVTYETSW